MRVPLTPLDFLERARRIYAPLEAAVDGDRRVTYRQFADRAHRLAHALRRDLGCRPGDRVAYLCGNTLELLEAYYGVVLAGAVLTPLNIRLSEREMQEVLDDCQPSLLVVHPSFAASDLAVRRRLDIGPEYERLLAGQRPDLFEPDP
ncbi:MAG: hypothetical protein QOG64_954, partial [Acidimicrobiaceae bacterium]|nr:hypothetical protein [Acidimicrobiaceae bacterium]